MQITLRTSAPLAHLRSRINAPFTHLQSVGDTGMVMTSALEVDAEKSAVTYQKFHADWDARIAAEAELLRDLKADYVFSNVGYLPLAGAQQAGIKNAALCSLNWHDIYRYYCGDNKITRQIFDSYAHADAFLHTTPGMAMESLPNVISVAPIADIGCYRRDELHRRLHLARDEKLVLVSMGGIATRFPMERWPRIAGVKFLVQENWQVQHPDAIMLESLHMDFGDLLASCDVLLCKPGYGSFVEAVASGVPVLYVSRADWPESAALIDWLDAHGSARPVSREQLERGDIDKELSALFAQPPAANFFPGGAAQVATWLAEKIA